MYCTIRIAALCLAFSFVVVPVPALAQGGPGSTNNLSTRLAALEARVAKLEGAITAADLVGTYRATGLITDLDGDANNPAGVQIVALSATVTLNANGTGTILQQGGGIFLQQGDPNWTSGAGTFAPEQISITWSYANGALHVSDGTVNLDLDFNVGVGGRVLTWSGLSDDDTADLVVAVRLQ